MRTGALVFLVDLHLDDDDAPAVVLLLRAILFLPTALRRKKRDAEPLLAAVLFLPLPPRPLPDDVNRHAHRCLHPYFIAKSGPGTEKRTTCEHIENTTKLI